MAGSLFNVIYIGIPPKGGICSISPAEGISMVTEFSIVTGKWIDPDGITEIKFFYSFDSGVTFLPIDQPTYTASSIIYVFDAIY